MDIRLVTELLVHEDIKSMVVYTEATAAALSEVVLRLPWKLTWAAEGARISN